MTLPGVVDAGERFGAAAVGVRHAGEQVRDDRHVARFGKLIADAANPIAQP